MIADEAIEESDERCVASFLRFMEVAGVLLDLQNHREEGLS
jgi:hypothetical protein